MKGEMHQPDWDCEGCRESFAAEVEHVIVDDAGYCRHPDLDGVQRAFRAWSELMMIGHDRNEVVDGSVVHQRVKGAGGRVANP